MQMTLAPSREKSAAVSRPIPYGLPVITAIRPESNIGVSLELDVGFLHHLRPARDFPDDEGAECGGVQVVRLDALSGERLAGFRQGQYFLDPPVQLADDGTWCAGRYQYAPPDGGVEARQTGLVQRRHAVKEAGTLKGGCGEPNQLARQNMRTHRRR